MHALIVGAGIAGPALGIFLRRLGHAVTLCERRQASAFAEGSFLGLAPNGMNIVEELGCRAQVLEAGAVCSGIEFLNAHGTPVGHIDGRDYPHVYGNPLVIVRRSHLHATLLAAAQGAGVELRVGEALSQVDSSSPDRVVATFSSGAVHSADFLVGCDGIRSTTRSLVMPSSPEPASLGLADFAGYGRDDDAPIAAGWNAMVFGRRAFFGAFRREDGEIWWFHNGGAACDARDEDALRAHLIGAHEGDPPWIRRVIESSPCVRGPWFLHDILTLPRWYEDRVCLIGDAAHACSPSAGQGASLALEDAMMLACSLRDADDPRVAFGAFQQRRQRRVERIVRQSRRNGSPKVARSRLDAWIRDRTLRFFLKLGASAATEQYGYRMAWSAPDEVDA